MPRRSQSSDRSVAQSGGRRSARLASQPKVDMSEAPTRGRRSSPPPPKKATQSPRQRSTSRGRPKAAKEVASPPAKKTPTRGRKRKAEEPPAEEPETKVDLSPQVQLTCNTVEPRYNEVLGTMKITLLYQGKKNYEI